MACCEPQRMWARVAANMSQEFQYHRTKMKMHIIISQENYSSKATAHNARIQSTMITLWYPMMGGRAAVAAGLTEGLQDLRESFLQSRSLKIKRCRSTQQSEGILSITVEGSTLMDIELSHAGMIIISWILTTCLTIRRTATNTIATWCWRDPTTHRTMPTKTCMGPIRR